MAKQGIVVLLLSVQYVQCLSITFTHYRQGLWATAYQIQ